MTWSPDLTEPLSLKTERDAACPYTAEPARNHFAQGWYAARTLGPHARELGKHRCAAYRKGIEAWLARDRQLTLEGVR